MLVASLLFMSKLSLKQEMAHMKSRSCFSIFPPFQEKKKKPDLEDMCPHLDTQMDLIYSLN